MTVSLLFVGCQRDSNVLIAGVTEFEPMNFRDEAGNWTGFDTEFALLVGERLGMPVEFQLIAWAQKFTELNAGAIDAIWNGFTATANEPDGTPRITLCDMSFSYMLNTQCIVVRRDRLHEFTGEADLEGKSLAVESGSAGESKAANLVGESGNTVGVLQQINTFLEVMTGAADGAIIDVILAQQLIGRRDFADLEIAFELGPEVYAIGFRMGDPLRDRVNAVMVELYNEGKLHEIAAKYGLEDRLVIDTTFGVR
jgi:polar amino acid transport system substrate-binding protein